MVPTCRRKPGRIDWRPSITCHNTVLSYGNQHKNDCNGINLLHNNIAHIFIFSFLVFEKNKLRVCGAEVERTLQKGGGGFEFAIKIIAYHSLSPSFSPLKSIIFLSLAILSLRFMWMVNSYRLGYPHLILLLSQTGKHRPVPKFVANLFWSDRKW